MTATQVPSDKVRARARTRLFAQARRDVDRNWSNSATKVGATLYEALLAHEILRLAACQDESIRDSTIREIVDDGYSWVCDEVERIFQ